MVRITLNREDLYKVLQEKYGDGHFVLNYIESDAAVRSRIGEQEYGQLTAAPRKEAYVLHIDP